MATEPIVIGTETHEIEVRPITLICQSAASALGPRIKYPNRVPLEPETTTYHAQRVQKLHPEFDKVWRLFMAATTPATPVQEAPITAEDIRKGGGMGALHLMGLIDMTLKFTTPPGIDIKVAEGKTLKTPIPVAWIYPESFLHPGWQVALGDVVIYLSKTYGGDGKQTAVADPK